jgi:hypothetical protein
MLTPAPTSIIASHNALHPQVYLDENTAIGVRQGPGCEYTPLQEAVTLSDQGLSYSVLGNHGDWWLVDLGNQLQGWVFGPVYKDNNFILGDAENELPDIKVSPAVTLLPTEPSLNSMADPTEEAGHTLAAFFSFLHDHDYKNAAGLFGTSLNWLIMWNPDVDPSNHAALLEAGCETNGFDCLQLNRVVKSSRISDMEYLFTVEFLDDKGNIYQFRGPVDANVTPPTQFQFRVVRGCDGRYFVVTYPIYGG